MTKDALAGKHGEYEIVLANPPFGRKSSVTIVDEAGESSKESLIINRDDLPPPRLCKLPTLSCYMRYHAGSLGKHEQVRAALAGQLIFLQLATA